jgi:ribosomal protein S21
MVEVKKRDGESVEALLRRFTKRVQQSGVLLRAKKSRFYNAPKTKREQRAEAQRRSVIRDQKEYLRKIGKLEELLAERAKSRGRRRGASIAQKLLKMAKVQEDRKR